MSVSTPTVNNAVTLSDALLPRRANALLHDITLIVGASALVTACAQISIPLPWTPVPLTGQTFGVLLAGILLGKRRGAMALTLYLLEGVAGLPVFTGGKFGIMPFFGPTAGYLFSFPIAAFVVGWLAERGWDRKPLTAAAAMLLGSLLILTLGTVVLSGILGHSAFEKGFLPFVAGDMLKVVVAAALLPTAWRFFDRRESES